MTRGLPQTTDLMVQETFDVHTQVFRADAPVVPMMMTHKRTQARLKLITDEVQELIDAILAGDYKEQADAVGDIIVTALGYAFEAGMPILEIMHDINQSNSSKLDDDGNPVHNEWGKVVKGKNYRPPNLEAVLVAAGATDELLGAHTDPKRDLLTKMGWPELDEWRGSLLGVMQARKHLFHEVNKVIGKQFAPEPVDQTPTKQWPTDSIVEAARILVDYADAHVARREANPGGLVIPEDEK